MCYNIKYTAKKIIDYATKRGLEIDPAQIPIDYYYVSGFDHPSLPVVTSKDLGVVQMYQWGLIPYWTKTLKDAGQIRTRTLNAVGETAFEKASFKSSVARKRCLILVDGFYEYHHHHSGKKIPYLIENKNEDPLTMGGIYESWKNPEDNSRVHSVSIVTVPGNALMVEIHNNPAVMKRIGPRMPLILPENVTEAWLSDEQDQQAVNTMMVIYPDEWLKYKTVGQLQGKNGLGNVPEASQHYDYQIADIP